MLLSITHPNFMKGLLASSGLVLAAVMSHSVLAADNRPHQHGEGELNIVLDDHDFLLEIRLPAADVVGFEHSPNNDEQKTKVERALASFQAAAPWFEPASQAQCQLESTSASLVGMTTGDQARAEPVAKHSHGHKHKHDDSHQHSDASQSGDSHSDFEGIMEFHCDAPDKLDALAVKLFQSYPGVTRLRVQMVTPTSQISRQLTPEESVLAINP